MPERAGGGPAHDASGAAVDVRSVPRDAALERALAAAAELLLRARRPLLCGLAEATVEAQRAAAALAERLGGVIDPAGSHAHAPASLAFRSIGEVTATLGEARTRAELLVFWGVDPDAVHPGFGSRYLSPAPGAPPRTALAVDVGDARGPADVAERIAVEPEWELELLWALRAAIKGRRLAPPPGAEIPAWPPARISELARRLARTRYGILFFDAEPPHERMDAFRPLALGALAMDANPGARLRVLGVRPPNNAAGLEAVLTWQTGHPSGVDFSRGYPRYGPVGYGAQSLLARGDVDAVLLVGSPGELAPRAREALARLPLVCVGAAPAGLEPAVTVRTRSPEATPGSVYRMDGIALRRRVQDAAARAQADLPTDEDVLRRLLELAAPARAETGT